MQRYPHYRLGNTPPPHPLARISPETIKLERAELYAHVLPPGQHIPIEVAFLPVDDNIQGGGGVLPRR